MVGHIFLHHDLTNLHHDLTNLHHDLTIHLVPGVERPSMLMKVLALEKRSLHQRVPSCALFDAA